MYDLYKDKGITKIVGIESRGFVMSSALALRLGAGVVLCRKPGKLPCDTVQESYAKEYGKDTIEIHKDAIGEDDVILLHDDLLATGGTMKAACNLVKKFHPKKVYANFIIELVNEGLNGRDGFDEDIEITSSIPTILVMPLSLYRSYISSQISFRHSLFLNRVVTSRKLTPFFGQSGMQRRLSSNSLLFIFKYLIVVCLFNSFT